MSNIKLDSTKHSEISEHILTSNHFFDWMNVRILDYKQNYYKCIKINILSKLVIEYKQKYMYVKKPKKTSEYKSTKNNL